MTDLEYIKLLTKSDDEDLLNGLLEAAQEEVLSMCNRTKMIDSLIPAKRKLAVVAYNRLGTEGETSRSEGGISSAFAEIPKDIEQIIMRYRLGRVSGHAYEKEPDEEVSSEEESAN